MEMAFYDQGGERNKNFESAYNVLLAKAPTSVEAERVLSASGYLCNHLRTALKDDSLDCFKLFEIIF